MNHYNDYSLLPVFYYCISAICFCIFSIREENVFNSPRYIKGVNSLVMNIVNTVH